MLNALRNFWNDEEGSVAVEYAVLVAMIGVALIAALTTAGGDIGKVITDAIAKLKAV